MTEHFKKIVPYSTKTGILMGSRYEQPLQMETDPDMLKLQASLLSNKKKFSFEPFWNYFMPAIVVWLIIYLTTTYAGRR
jgi:hypothetical protein